jgi:uncharacterized protein (TIGR00369 family)
MDEATSKFPILDRLQQAIGRNIPGAPIAALMGWRTVEAESGRVVMEMEAEPRMANPMGTLHGGVLTGLADSAMAMAHASLLGEGESFTTLELKINFLRPVWNGTLRAEGKMVKGGRNIGLVECRVTTADGQLVAHATSTCMTLRGEEAKGR